MKFDARGCEGDLEKPWNIVFIIMSFMTTGKLLTYTLSLIATKNLCAFFFSFLLFLSCWFSLPLAKLEVAYAAISLFVMLNLCILTRLASFYYRQQLTNSSSLFLSMEEVQAVTQKVALHSTFSPSPHRRWTSLILSADLQIPLQLQSNEAMQTFPAWAFHSQSAAEKNLQLKSWYPHVTEGR